MASVAFKMERATLSRGFSLVEIVLALGIVGFAIVTLFGLLSAGIHSSKDSLDDSLIAAMARQVASSLQQQQFAGNQAISSLSGGKPIVCYFDANGILTGNNGQDVHQAVYQCTVTGVGDSQLLGPQPPGPAPSPSLLDLTFTFQWPIQAPKANNFTIRTSLAKYY